jgi:hypothetical protein
MAASTFEDQKVTVARTQVDWGAIWAGMFTFVAIWSVFGVLGAAIFASAANPSAAHPVMEMGVGMSIWAVILTIIAMYVAGLETGRLAAVSSKSEAIIHGMAMFGLSMVAVLVLLAVGGSTIMGATTSASAHSPFVLSVISGLGWAGFISLFLSWLAAMIGASSGIRSNKTQTDPSVQPIRKVA